MERIHFKSLVLLSEVSQLEARAELFRMTKGKKDGHLVPSTVNKFSTKGTSNNYFKSRFENKSSTNLLANLAVGT